MNSPSKLSGMEVQRLEHSPCKQKVPSSRLVFNIFIKEMYAFFSIHFLTTKLIQKPFLYLGIVYSAIGF